MVRAMLVAALFLAVRVDAQLPQATGSFAPGTTTVTVPFRVVHELVVIPVMLNDVGPFHLILDTGAPVMLIPDTAIARRTSMQVAGQVRVAGVGDGPARMAPIAIGARAGVGAFTIENATAVFGVGGEVIPAVDGVIGGPLFQHSVVEIDWDAMVVRFHERGAFVAPALPGLTSLPLRVRQDLHVFAQAVVRVDDEARPVELHFDTGSRQGLMLSRPIVGHRLRSMPALKDVIVSHGVGGPARGDIVRVRELQLGGQRVANVATVVPTKEQDDSARVGLPVLRNFRVFIDYAGGRVLLAPRAGRVPERDLTTTGLRLAANGGRTFVRIEDVVPGSPAKEAGLAPGDTIIALDERELTGLEAHEVNDRMVVPAPGTAVRLRVRRGGRPIDVTLTARELLP